MRVFHDKKKFSKLTASALSAICLFGLGSAAVGHADTIVDPSNMGNWAFDNRDSLGIVGANPTGGGSFVNGPDTPPSGVGSANLFTGNGTIGGDGAGELRNTGFAGVALSSLSALSYFTYATVNNGQQFPYLGLVISTTGGATSDDILFFEPPYQQPGTGNPSLPDQGVPLLNTWQSWNALTGGWWDNNGNANPGAGVGGVEPLSFFDSLFPNATIVNAADGLGGVRFDVGFASAGDQFNGNIDAFTIGDAAGTTTFDFEPGRAAAVPEPASLLLLATGLLGMGVIRRRRKIV